MPRLQPQRLLTEFSGVTESTLLKRGECPPEQ
jgi:hypothetical protein